MIVTIDGPAGTGKSSVAKQLAERLGFEFLNTGAMYRAVAFACLQRGIPLTDEEGVGSVTTQLKIHFSKNCLILDGTDVTDAIRSHDVTQGASIVAANPKVRMHLVELQRAAAIGFNLVTEGRDQGTVVFPNAECKFFLTASPEERAFRRQLELETKGEVVSLNELLKHQELRDTRDESRKCSPLRPATDAQIVDTTSMSLEQVISLLERIVRDRVVHTLRGQD